MSALWGSPPRIGIVANSIGVFSDECKQAVETQMRGLFEQLKAAGEISEDSIFHPRRIFGPLEAQDVLDRFIRAKIDALVVLHSAFPQGNAFLTFATDPYLRHIPLLVTAPPEFDLPSKEWSVNACCGMIMNNFVARRIGRPIFTLCGMPSEAGYQAEFRRVLRVARAVREMRRDLLGKFGDAPSGFHSCTGDQLAYAKLFGTRIETVDLSSVLQTYQTGKAKGLLGERSFDDQDVQASFRKITDGREVLCDPEKVRRAARLYHAYKSLIEANGYTSVTVRCWPELMNGHVRLASCLVIGWLLSEGVVRSAACEGDWTTAVAQSIGALLTGKPAVSLDFVNDLAARSTVQLGHCGVGVPCLMSECRIGEISPDRQAGELSGPTCIGQFEYGPKTGVSIIQDDGRFKMLAFSGHSGPRTAAGLLISAADIELSCHRRLNELIFEHGFPHHLAVAFGDVAADLKLLCHFYGMEYLNPENG